MLCKNISIDYFFLNSIFLITLSEEKYISNHINSSIMLIINTSTFEHVSNLFIMSFLLNLNININKYVNILVLILFLSSCNHFHIILEFYKLLVKVPFTKNKTNFDTWYKTLYITTSRIKIIEKKKLLKLRNIKTARQRSLVSILPCTNKYFALVLKNSKIRNETFLGVSNFA